MVGSNTPTRFEVARGADGHWRWRFVDENDTLVAKSCRGYTSKQETVRDLRSLQANASSAPVVLPEDSAP